MFLIRLSDSDQTLVGRVEFHEQPEEQQVFSAIWRLEGDVNHDGFGQYFRNAEDHEASFVVTALRRIGASRCADIVSRAIRTVSPGALPQDQIARQQLIDDLGQRAQEALELLDQEFCSYPDDLTELLFEYVRSNPQVFGPIHGE